MADEFSDLIPGSAPSTGAFDDLIPQAKQPVGTMEGLVNALRRGLKTTAAIPAVVDLASTGTPFQGILARERSKWGMPQDILLQERQANAAQRVAEKMAAIEDIPRSEAQQRLTEASGAVGKFRAWLNDPLELTSTIILESLPPSIAGGLTGFAMGGGPGMVAGVGLSSGLATFSSELLANASQRGVDIRDPEALTGWLNSRNFDDDFEMAATKSTVIGGIDASTAGMAGRFMKPALRTGLKNVAKAGAKELGMQAVGGAAGEAIGSAAAGQHIDPFDVFAEAIAEVASGPAEIIGNVRREAGAQRLTRAQGERQELRDRIQRTLEEVAQPQERVTRSQESTITQPIQPAQSETSPAQLAISQIEELPNNQAGQLGQRDAVRAGMALAPNDVPALEAARDAAMQRMVAAGEAGQNDVFKAEYGRNIFYSGMIEGARRSGPNYEQFKSETTSAKGGENIAEEKEESKSEGQAVLTTPAPVQAVPEPTPQKEVKQDDTQNQTGIRAIQQEGQAPVETRQQAVSAEEIKTGRVVEEALTPKPPLGDVGGDSPARNTILLRNLARDLIGNNPGLEKGFGFIDGPARLDVLTRMITAAQDNEVFNAIVSSLPVDVVNMLTREKLSPEVLFHDESVLGSLFSSGKRGIDVIAPVVDAVIRGAAGIGAKVAPDGNTARGSKFNQAAVGAGNTGGGGIPSTTAIHAPTIPAALGGSTTHAAPSKGQFGVLAINQPKVSVQLLHDPGGSAGGPRVAGPTEGIISIGQRGKNSGWLLIQWRTSPGAEPRTVWRAKISDLQAAGIMQDESVDLDKLYASPLLQKVEDKTGNFKAVKLPTERAERAEGADIDSVIEQAGKLNTFYQSLLMELQNIGWLTTERARALAGARTGGAQYAGKTGGEQAAQILRYLRNELETRMEQLRGQNSEEFRTYQAMRQRLMSEQPTFTKEDVVDAAVRLSSDEGISQLVAQKEQDALGRVETSLEGGRRGESTSGDEGQDTGLENILGQWDPQQMENVIGQIEEMDPKLYASFNAEPDNDGAWSKIAAGLTKLFAERNLGTPQNAEELADLIREMRSNNHLFNPGEVPRVQPLLNQVKRFGTARGHAGIRNLFQDRSLPMNPQMREIALALLDRIPAKYFNDLTVKMTAEGGLQGEFINALRMALVAVNAKDPQTAAHEMSHYLATFLTDKERSVVSALRRKAIAEKRGDPLYGPFIKWLEERGGQATSAQYITWASNEKVDPNVVAAPGGGFVWGRDFPPTGDTRVEALRRQYTAINDEVAMLPVVERARQDSTEYLLGLLDKYGRRDNLRDGADLMTYSAQLGTFQEKEAARARLLRWAKQSELNQLDRLEKKRADVQAAEMAKRGAPDIEKAFAKLSEKLRETGAYNITGPVYHLINDDEFFAHQFTQAAMRRKPEELAGIIARVKDFIARILDSLKAHFGDRDAYFNNLLRMFERGDLSVDAQGGLLYERNQNPKMMGLVSRPSQAERFGEVEQGPAEEQVVRGLTIEQNEPMVGHVRELFEAMPAGVKANLSFIKDRLQVLGEAVTKGRVASNSPIRTYATIQNGLELEQQSRKLSAQIDSLVEKLAQKQEELPSVSAKEAEAKALHETVQGIIRDYKDQLMQQARADEAAGKATALEQAIKYLDSLQSSTTSLERAVQYMAERLSVEELTDPTATTESILNLFKQKLSQDNAGRPWQEATIPSGQDQPGVSNDQLRSALLLMQQRMKLSEDLLELRELHDPGLRQMIQVNENEFDQELKGLTRGKLNSFLNKYYGARTEKDRARAVYLKHRRQVRGLLRSIQEKLTAYDFVHNHILNSPQFKSAMGEARGAGFMDDSLYVDESNNRIHRRIYKNPNQLGTDEKGEPKSERAIIEYGFSRAIEQKNIEEFQKVIGWLEEYLRTGTDPLMRSRAEFELRRIYDYELNPAWSPESGKFAPSPYNPLMWVSNLVGGSSQFVLNRIGGRAAMQAANLHTLYDDGKREATEARHHLRWPKTKAVLDAAKAHEMDPFEWRDKVADPLLVYHNSLGAKAPQVGDKLWTGETVKAEDIAAIKAQKTFLDGVAGSIFRVKTKLGELFPVKTLEKLFGREIYRPQQGHSPYTMPRRLSDAMHDAIRSWNNAKRGRGSKDAMADMRALVESGPLFEQLVLAHIRSMNLYPEYTGSSKFKKAYQEIWREIKEGGGPASFTELVNSVFDKQAGQDSTGQMSKEDIAREILLGEIDAMMKRVAETPEYEHDTLGGGTTVDILSGNNFLNRPRGKMIAPDTGYHYSIIDNTDENWVMRSALEVNLQRYRDGLQRVKDGLESEMARFRNEAERAKGRQDQVSGEQWLDYGEAKTLLRQVNTLLDRSSPQTFNLFIDQSNRGIFRHFWGLVQQSLLGAFPVMWRNFMGGSMRLAHADALMNSNGLAMGIPKWLMRLPVTLARGAGRPLVDTAGLLKKHFDYKKVKAALGEDVIRAIQKNPELINQYSSMVAAEAIQNAAIYQDALDLDVVGNYGLRNQLEQYLHLFSSGGEIRQGDVGPLEKLRGGLISTIGLAQEAGIGPVLLPRAIAPRKIEQVINFAAMMRAKRVIDQLQVNLLKAARNREELGGTAQRLTPEEIIGDPKAKESWVAYLRNLFTRGGVNLDYAAQRYLSEARQNPNAQLLTDAERRAFYLAFMKEVNMAGSENRVRFKSEAAQVLSSLMGYGFYQNEAFANAMARFSRDNKGGMNALNKALMVAGITTLIAVGMSQPWQRLMRALLFNEEDPAGRFSSENTNWRNAQIFWEQTAPFWPITGSLLNQLYDVRAGGNKFFNFLPMSVLTSLIQAGNEAAATGNIVNPAIRLMKQWVPNSKLILNRIPGQEGLVDVNNASRIFREVNDGSVEVRPVSNQPIRPSPISDEVRAAVNELVKDNPDWSTVEAMRKMAVADLSKQGIKPADAEKRFDSAVLARTPQNTVYGKALTQEERSRQLARMNPTQREMVEAVESAFDRYAVRYGVKPRALTTKSKVTVTGTRGSTTLRASVERVRPRLTRGGGFRRGLLRRKRRVSRVTRQLNRVTRSQ